MHRYDARNPYPFHAGPVRRERTTYTPHSIPHRPQPRPIPSGWLALAIIVLAVVIFAL